MSNFNLHVSRITFDREILQETLGSEADVTSKDELIKILLEMYRNIYMDADDNKGNFVQTANCLGILWINYTINRNGYDSDGDKGYNLN